MVSETYGLQGKRVWVAGHRGMVGSALVRALKRLDCEVVTAGRPELDLLRQEKVESWMERMRPQAIFVAAAKVGGIHANHSYPADFLYENLMIEANIIHAAHGSGVEKLLFLGSSCIYPRLAPQPIPEEALLTGPLEPTNEWYAIAKIAGIKLCQAYRRQHGARFVSAMPTNLYGPEDNFHPENSHVLPALLRRIHEAKIEGRNEVVIWGSGEPRREFLHVDDLATALIFLMQSYEAEEHINIGSGEDLTIRGLAQAIAAAVGWGGSFRYDGSRPDGVPRKLMDSSRLRSMGWTARISLEEGLASTYAWYLANGARAQAA